MTEATHDTDPQRSAARQPWQVPTAEVLPVSETATGPIVTGEGTGATAGS
jgi:hypothetical protein